MRVQKDGITEKENNFFSVSSNACLFNLNYKGKIRIHNRYLNWDTVRYVSSFV